MEATEISMVNDENNNIIISYIQFSRFDQYCEVELNSRLRTSI